MTHRVFTTSVASVYKHYIAKAAKKGRGRDEVDAVTRWLTGYSQDQLVAALDDGTDFRTFFDQAPAMNPARSLVTGSVCGVKVQEVEDPLMREIRILDKLVDELSKGRSMDKVLRTPA
ncbi:DUF2200 domain-containing protein [Sphingomonas sabuli]|uniref:DUF2200 domain-containing protein n=1 Tax=Sphingomonas sabuli TaxID=2764186 RepID=A0A7G9L5K5_9SPHN|nr:DUF2200 domain-containing protein [Sphingomonas sabuli]QNM83904.1 DUF2200 domain-containing protein [Sphingomonas sabuli]